MTKEEKNWSFLDCEICYKNSYQNHRSREKEDEFKLCEHCTKTLEEFRGEPYPLKKKLKNWSHL
jgi:hypothetical protein